MKGKRTQRNNKGFTLIELIVTSLVGVTIFLSVMAFLGFSLKYSQNVGASTTVQKESQIAQNQVGALMKEAVSVTKMESGGSLDSYLVDTGRERMLLVYDQEKKRVLMGEANEEGTNEEEIADSPEKGLLASRVSGFSISGVSTSSPGAIDSKENRAMVQVTITVELDGKSVSSTNQYALRNGIW